MMYLDPTSHLLKIAEQQGKTHLIQSRDFNVVNEVVSEIVNKEFTGFFNEEYKKPYNAYSLYDMVQLTIKVTEGLDGDILARIFVTMYKDSGLVLPEELVQDIASIFINSNNKKAFVKNANTFTLLVAEKNLYHKLSLLISYLSGKKAVNMGNMNLWVAMETIIAIMMLGLIVGDSIHTGLFTYSNPYTKMNHLLETHQHKIKKKELPNWFNREMDEIGYSTENKITIFQFFMTYQSFFHFYDSMIYKHSLKMFDSILTNQCRNSLWMTNYFRDIDVQVLEPGFKIFGIDEIEKINDYTSQRKTIFFQTAFKTVDGNKYLGTELLTESGRKLIVFGNKFDIGQFIVEINLSELDKPGNLKFYTMSYDWAVKRLGRLADKIILEILQSYVYMSLDECGHLDRIEHMKVEHVPTVLKYDKSSHVYDSFNVLKSEYRELAPIIRRLPKGQHISDDAKTLANKMHYHVPEGYTFVQGFEKRVHVKESDDESI